MEATTQKVSSDIEIARQTTPEPIQKIAAKLGIDERYVLPYGHHKAKISLDVFDRLNKKNPDHKAKLVLVTAVSPTPAGEGKTTNTIGLADALARANKSVAVALREPSLGPVFGMKGGAAGGGYAQAIPMEDINLHFTGDFHAIASANNLLAALLDNHLKQGNELNIDPRRIVWHRCLDMNDRQLRHIVSGLGGLNQGVPHEDSFDITAASEIMAVLCLSSSLKDLKNRLARMIVAYDYQGKPVCARDLKAEGALCSLLKDAIKPNLVQTLEGTPVFMHGGPFANIAHGCNSILATRLACQTADIVLTEAGFGADLGAEKFLDIVCPTAQLKTDACVLVATIRSLKYNGGLNGGVPVSDLSEPNLKVLERGIANLERHLQNLQHVFGLSCLVALNSFPTDTPEEVECVRGRVQALGAKLCVSKVWAEGGKGASELASELIRLLEEKDPTPSAAPETPAANAVPKTPASGESPETPSTLAQTGVSPQEAISQTTCYDKDDPLEKKIEKVAQRIYHADSVKLSATARKQLKQIKDCGFDDLFVCIAKTQYSFTDKPRALGAPEHFSITVRELRVSAGAGFVVALTGSILTMPGLPRHPAAEKIDINDEGEISGLF